ncbi:TPA: hypothetical protein L9L57_005041 [Klebsiella pneumoniae]|nr:hypothetical protein [Klebsiella pneumoniae]HBR1477745.1 hypothetical protein [Klebsiella pneumoniae]
MKAKVFFASLVVLASGCSSITPKTEVQTSYWIYDIQTDKSASEVGTAVVEALQSQMSSVNVSRNIPPSPLPYQAGRFQMSNALEKSNLGILMANSGVSLQMPICDGAIMIASSQNSGMSNWGENTSANSCLWQYKGGYHLDIIVKFTNSSGGYDAKSLAKALVNPVMGDSSQFIPTRINNISNKLNAAGLKTTLVEKYP